MPQKPTLFEKALRALDHPKEMISRYVPVRDNIWSGKLRRLIERQAFDLKVDIRKAEKFVIEPSAIEAVTKYSLKDPEFIEYFRHRAQPPFPLTWVEFDQGPRVEVLEEEATKKGLPRSVGVDVARRVGLLLRQSIREDTFEVITFVEHKSDRGEVQLLPLTFLWSTNDEPIEPTRHYILEEMAQAPFKMVDIDPGMATMGLFYLEEYKAKKWLPFVDRMCQSVRPHLPPVALMTLIMQVTESAKDDEARKNICDAIVSEHFGSMRFLYSMFGVIYPEKFINAKAPDEYFPAPHGRNEPLPALRYRTITMTFPRITRNYIRHGVGGVKKGEHEVIPFYRRPAGSPLDHPKTIRVRAHKRGDPTLGKIIQTRRITAI